MSSFRIIKRGVLFGIDGDSLTRSDVVGTEEGTVQQSGQAVAVLFGTRAIEPVVVSWGSAGARIVNYYDPTLNVSGTQPISDANRLMRMVNLTMRMMLCEGEVDSFSAWTAGGILFRVSQQPLPSGSRDNARYRYLQQFDSRADISRLEVAIGDIDLFGGGEAGGLGSSLGREATYSVATQYSEFWWGRSGNIPDSQLDLQVEYRGLSSFYFRLFNFGGSLPPPSWQVTATRIDYQTTRDDNTNTYKEQWQKDLATIQTLPNRSSATFYFHVLSQSLTTSQRQQVGRYIRAMPYDDDTAYQFMIMSRTTSNGNPTGKVISQVFSDRASALTYFETNYERTANRTYSSNFFQIDASDIVETYGARMASNLTALRQERGVVTIFSTDVFGGFPASLRTGGTLDRELVEIGLTGVAVLMSILNNPIVPQGDLSIIGNPLTARQQEAVSKSPADVRLALFTYRRSSSQLATNPYRFTDPWAISDSAYRRFRSIDGYDDPIGIGGTTRTPTDAEFVTEFRTILPVGQSMNPIHALRETLINKSWGKGIEESYIDDSSFLVAAQTCKTEKLDFCYLHKAVDPNPIVSLVNDYTDGVTYYNPALDKVVIKLIRNDYSIGDLPSFDESSIAMVTNFKRQQANRVVNSVTVNYHDVTFGTDETVTIHDLESTSEQRAARTASLSLPGCATREAAARVAARELSALSKSIVSCTVRINPTQPLGLGDPIVISYRDLGLARIVMRVSKIDYGTGLTGGIDVELIQDVFSDPYYVDLVGEVTLPDEPERLADLPDIIKFLEMGYFDLQGITAPFASPNELARYFKVGRKSDPLADDATIEYNGEQLGPSIGTLLTPILPLTQHPAFDMSGHKVVVRFPNVASNYPFGTYIRIDDEIIGITGATKIGNNLYEVEVNSNEGRAWYDTVAKRHAIGSDVWFIGATVDNTNPWDGSPITIHQTKDGLVDSSQLSPGITFIQRGKLPLPPQWVTVDSKYIPTLIIDGDIVVNFQARPAMESTDLIVVRLTKGSTELYRQATTLPTPLRGVYASQSQTISATAISSQLSSGAHDLSLSVSSLTSDGNTASWQSWDYRIDWSATTRDHTGWTFNWGNNWGSGRTTSQIDGHPIFAQGWDYDYDQTWDI